MTFATVQSLAVGSVASNVTSHGISLPGGVTDGELLLVAFTSDGNPTISVGVGSGWTKIGQESNGTVVTGAVFWKIANAIQTNSLVISTTDPEQSSWVTARILNGITVTGSPSNGSSTNSNPPLFTPPPNNAKDYLWVATRHGDSTVNATAAPGSYVNFTVASGGGATASSNTALATRELNASSEDPGTFTSATEQWACYTLAVESGFTRAPSSDGLYHSDSSDPAVERTALGADGHYFYDTVAYAMLPVAIVTWARFETPVATGPNTYERAVPEGFYFLDARASEQDAYITADGMYTADSAASALERTALGADGVYVDDWRFAARDTVNADGLFAYDQRMSERVFGVADAYYLYDSVQTERGSSATVVDGLLFVDVRYQDSAFLRGEAVLLADVQWSVREESLLDGLLLATSLVEVVSEVQTYLRDVVDGLFTPDLAIREGAMGQLELMLFTDSAFSDEVYARLASDGLFAFDALYRAQELGVLDKLMHADTVLRALLPIGVVTWAQIEVTNAPQGQSYERQVTDGFQFTDPTVSDQHHVRQTPLLLPDFTRFDRAFVYLEGLLLGSVVNVAAGILREVSAGDGLYLRDDRTYSMFLSIMTKVLVETVPLVQEFRTVFSDGMYLADPSLVRDIQDSLLAEGLLLGDTSFATLPVIERQALEELLLGSVVRLDNISRVISDGLLLDPTRRFDLHKLLADAELLGSAVDYSRSRDAGVIDALLLGSASTSAAERVRALTDTLMLDPAMWSELMRALLEDFLLGSSAATEFAGMQVRSLTDGLYLPDERSSELLFGM